MVKNYYNDITNKKLKNCTTSPMPLASGERFSTAIVISGSMLSWQQSRTRILP